MAEIIVNGVAIPVHFGIKALNEFQRSKGEDFSNLFDDVDNLDIESFLPIIKHGLNEGERRSGSSKRYSDDDVWDLIDERPELLYEIPNIFITSIVPLVDKMSSIGKNVNPTVVQKQE